MSEQHIDHVDSSSDYQKHFLELVKLLEEYDNRCRYRKLDFYFCDSGPFSREFYPKQLNFMSAGQKYTERALFGANRVGKSTVAAYEVACHATGDYPEWWTGKRFYDACSIWAAADTHSRVAEIAQEILLGPISDLGSGLIPKNKIIDYKVKPGVPNAIADVWIQHSSGHVSRISFKSYVEGRTGFQGTSRHVIWLDEECPSDIYTECLLRIMTTEGILLLTFTPLSGLTSTVLRFLPEGKFPEHNAIEGMSRWITSIDWDDPLPHLSEDTKKKFLASLQPHEIEARTKGIPNMGSGKVYTTLEQDFIVEPFKIPSNWPKAYGMDVGWKRTACVWGVYDENNDTIYIYDELYISQSLPVVIAESIKHRGNWLTGAIDPAANISSQADGAKLLNEYRDLGLNLIKADNAVEAGIARIINYLTSGRLKVFSNCTNFIKEYRQYSRDDNGKIMKRDDHAMDAWRYLLGSFFRIMQTSPDDDLNDKERALRALRSNSRNHITGY